MKQFSVLILMLCACCGIKSQMVQPPPTVFVYINKTAYPMPSVTSQVEIKKGWEIQGINVNRKPLRYFWGAHAKQAVDNLPTFAIYPTTQKLNDYVLIRLKQKKEYRRLPYADMKDCPYVRVDLENFTIENLPDMGFAVTPQVPLQPGEYILADMTQQAVNQYGDFKAYDFTVTKENKKAKNTAIYLQNRK